MLRTVIALRHPFDLPEIALEVSGDAKVLVGCRRGST